MIRHVMTYFILIFFGVASGQNQRNDIVDQAKRLATSDRGLAIERVILKTLSAARISASLQYWESCDSGRQLPRFPKTVASSGLGDSPLETFRAMFHEDPAMELTQDADGTIRMSENTVPHDILDVKIEHISFNESYEADDALKVILNRPEVQSFMKTHDVGWPSQGRLIVGAVTLPAPGMPHLSGELSRVTLYQALNYVLKTFPGFWVYQNCLGQTRKREVFFKFFTY